MRFGKPKEDDADLDEVETTEEEPSQMPLMMGARPEGLDGDIDLHSMGDGSKLFNKSSMLIVAVLLIAGGAIYAMRLSQNEKAPSEEVKKSEARIEQLMTQLKSNNAAGGSKLAKDSVEALMNDADFIIDQLDLDTTKRQVPVEFTKKNPFYLFVDQAIPVADPVKPTEDAEAKRIAELMKKLDAEMAKLKIQSILPNGRKPVAIIDNKIVQVGEAVGSFKVKEIQKLAVVLEAEGKEFILSIENDPNKADVKNVKGR